MARGAPCDGQQDQEIGEDDGKQDGGGHEGTTLTGVTFISVPGAVGAGGFGYLQVILGYVLGYVAVAFILLPLYYRLKLTSIYHYLDVRLGGGAYRSGAAFFILSRLLSASARLYLVVNILQLTILDSLGIPFWLTTVVILAMILLYTYEGGVKTIDWTDTLQTTGMVLGTWMGTLVGWRSAFGIMSGLTLILIVWARSSR